MDLIGVLPESQGYEANCVFVDLDTKQIHVVLTSVTVTLEGMAKLYKDHVFELCGLPHKIIHDKGPLIYEGLVPVAEH